MNAARSSWAWIYVGTLVFQPGASAQDVSVGIAAGALGQPEEPAPPVKVEKAVIIRELPPELKAALEEALKREGAPADLENILGDIKAEEEKSAPSTEPPAEEAKPGAEKSEKEKAAPEPPKPPPLPVLRLRDQTRLAGEIDMEALHVTTAYGPLVIPVSDVLRVRFAMGKQSAVDDKLEKYIQALGSDEFDAREEAMEKLREIGLPALEKLRKAAVSEDPEVKARAEKLVSELEELAEEDDGDEELALQKPLIGNEDEVVTVKFTVRGRVEETHFSLKTRWGQLDLTRDDVVSIQFRSPDRQVTKVTVPGTAFAAANKWVKSDVEVTEGQKLRIRATGTINLENYGQTTGPEGTTSIGGNQFQNFPTGSLIARIGEKGEPFQVGAEFQGPASATGKLEFAVSLQSGQVRGTFEVEVEREIQP